MGWIAVIIIGSVGIGAVLALILHKPKKPPLPTCFGNQPRNPQHQAEHDCPNCVIQTECWMYTMDEKL